MEKSINLSITDAREILRNENTSPELKAKLRNGFGFILDPISWDNMNVSRCFYPNAEGNVVVTSRKRPDGFRTEKEAESAMAYSKLSFLVYEYNKGWVPDWENGNQTKYGIILRNGKVAIRNTADYHFLTFNDESIASLFLDDQKELIETYFMINKKENERKYYNL